MKIPKKLIENYEKQQYRVIGKHQHSAVKICLWTKNSLRGKGACYKQKFYGIESHRCLQMTPALFFCDNRCLHCWRNTEKTISANIKKFGIDSPAEIIDSAIAAQRELLSGFPSNLNLDKKKFEEAMNPNQAAISLSGEPTLYPCISDLIKEFQKKNFTTFLVSNGLHPKVLEKIKLPTQLYISMNASSKELYKKLDKPLSKNAWKKFIDSLELLPSLKTRRAIRITAIKGLNMRHEKEFARIIEKANPDFLEVKGYMFVGYSRHRLKMENMPLHPEVKAFAEKINNHLNYTFTGESKESRVILLSSGKKKLKIRE
jgi:tRNA wybutosine-synthesizing protein 1